MRLLNVELGHTKGLGPSNGTQMNFTTFILGHNVQSRVGNYFIVRSMVVVPQVGIENICMDNLRALDEVGRYFLR